MQFTFSLAATCAQCGQTITNHDFQHGNWQFILPNAIFQHRTCPLKPPCYLKECANQPTSFF